MNTKIRSLLFVPAEERRLAKIGKINADGYIIDLEDSISKSDKELALLRTITFLESQKSDRESIYVRINYDRQKDEINALKNYSVGFMLPKISTRYDYIAFEDVLREHSVIALIETPKAIIYAYEIASLEWIDALAFGAEDFTAITNMYNSYTNLIVPKSILSIAAKACEKKVFDTPCFSLKDEQLLQEELEQAINLGYDGKLAVHPNQINTINQAFQIRDRVSHKC